MIARVRAECRREFSFQLRPTLWKIGILLKVWDVRDVVVLTEIYSFGVVPTIRWMITQRFHTFFLAFVNHDAVVVAAACGHTNSLESVSSSGRFIFTVQLTFERVIWLIRRSSGAHDFTVSTYRLPAVRSSTCRAQLPRTVVTVVSRVRTECIWKFALKFVPTTWEVCVIVSMRCVGNVVVLPDVRRFRIVFTIVWVITQGFHVDFGTLGYHGVVVVTASSERPQTLEPVKASIVASFAGQHPAERLIRSVWGRFHAQNFFVLGDCVPRVTSTCSTQGSARAAMRSCESTICGWELRLNLCPSARVGAHALSVARMREVIILTDVNGPRITFAVRGVITERFHALFGTFLDHNIVVISV